MMSVYEETNGAVRIRFPRDVASKFSFFKRDPDEISETLRNLIYAFLETTDTLVDHEMNLNFTKDDFKKCLLGEVKEDETAKSKPVNKAKKTLDKDSSDLLREINTNLATSSTETLSLLRKMNESVEKGVLLNSIMFKWTYMINYCRTRLNNCPQDEEHYELLKKEEGMVDSIIDTFYPDFKIPLRHRYLFNDLLKEVSEKRPNLSNASPGNINSEIVAKIESAKNKDINDSTRQ